MYKIEVRPTCVVVNDYSIGDNPQLEKSFTVYDKVTHTFYYKSIFYNNETSQLFLPRGIDIPYLERLFNVKAWSEHSCDPFEYNSEQVLLRYGPKDERQMEAMKFLLGQDNYSPNRNMSQLMLTLDTGAGKTYLGIAYIAAMNIRGIIITGSIGWLDQWKTRLREHTNMNSKDIYFIQGAGSITSLMKKSKQELAQYKVYLVSHSTISSLIERQGKDSVRELFVHLGIGIKIFDEAHLYFDSMSTIDFNTNTFKTVYMTATPNRGNKDEDKIFHLYFKNVPNITMFDPDNDPHTHYIALRYNSRMSPRDISRCGNIYGFNKNSYANLIVLNKHFDYMCRIVFDLIKDMPGRVLMFLASNQAIQIMYDWIYCNYPEYTGLVGIYTSINPNKSRALCNKIILTTSQSAGAALDLPGLFCSVQLAEPMKSPPQCKQRFGRTRAMGSYFIDVVDDSLQVLNKYFVNSLPMYEKYALDIKTMKFSDKQLEEQAFKIMDSRAQQGISPFVRL